MIVTKFGGSSLADSAQFKKVKDIIKSNPARRVVVVSAPGKRSSSDNKITDLLYTLGSHLKYGVPDDKIWVSIVNRYKEIKDTLNLDIDIEAELDAYSKIFGKDIDQDCLVSRGEYFCARLMSSYLGYTFVDAAEIIRFSYDGKLDVVESEKRARAAFDKYGSIVVPGFYGAYPNGDINLLSRGGSDVTGAYLSKFLNADIYENWTDVSGILAADPKLAKNPKGIQRVTYEELRELSYMGASVLHEDSILPVQEAGIAINLRNTNEPTNPGTIIAKEAGEGAPITGLAGKKGYLCCAIYKKHMSSEIGFFRKVLSIFVKYNINIEHTPTGMDMCGVIVSEEQAAKHIHTIMAEIETELHAEASIERDIALIAAVGRNMAGHPGICAAIFKILGEKQINVKMIAQSPDEHNVIVGISSDKYAEAISSLYDGLCAENIL
jgi:aspartate kinase